MGWGVCGEVGCRLCLDAPGCGREGSGCPRFGVQGGLWVLRGGGAIPAFRREGAPLARAEPPSGGPGGAAPDGPR